jgi:hypothetical protein
MVATVGASLLRPISRGSKAGKPRHVILTDEGQRLFAALTARRLGDQRLRSVRCLRDLEAGRGKSP